MAKSLNMPYFTSKHVAQLGRLYRALKISCAELLVVSLIYST